MAWQPGIFHNKVVVRAGGGMYYDRGELFSYFSPGYAIGTVTGGPFGVNQQLPFVNAPPARSTTQYLYQYYIPTCGGSGTAILRMPQGNLENPYGTSPHCRRRTIRKASDLNNYLPNATEIVNDYGQPISLGVYDRANKLPYTIQLHAGHPVAAAQRSGHRNRLRGQSRTSPGHSRALQPADDCIAHKPSAGGRTFQQKYSYGYTVS